MAQSDKRTAGPVPPPLKNSRKSAGIWKYVTAAVCLLIAAIILMAISMTLFFKVVSILGIALTIASIAVMLLTYRKSREIKPKAMYISIGMSLSCLLVYSLFLKTHLGAAVWMLGFVIGIGAGIGWSLVTPLLREGNSVKRAGNIWYLAVWGAVFALNQLLIMALGRTPDISMLLLVFGTGLVVGNSGAYVLRYYKLKAES